MGTINEPIKDFTAEQAQEYLNKSKLAKQMGRFFGPFKGMSVEAATEAAVKKIGTEHDYFKGSTYSEHKNDYMLAKATAKISSLPLDKRLNAERATEAFKEARRSFEIGGQEFPKPMIKESPGGILEDTALLRLISADIGIDLVNLKDMAKQKYPKQLENLEFYVKTYKVGVNEGAAAHQIEAKRSAITQMLTMERALCRTGDFDLHIKTRPEIFASSVRRLGPSAVNLLVNVPLGVGRLVLSPFIALVGLGALATGHGTRILTIAGSEAGVGVVHAFNSVVQFLATTIGTVVDPILGKEHMRAAHLYVRAGTNYAVVSLLIAKLNKYQRATNKYQETLTTITFFGTNKPISATHKVSKWNPASEGDRAKQFLRAIYATYGKDRIETQKTIQDLRDEREAIKNPKDSTNAHT